MLQHEFMDSNTELQTDSKLLKPQAVAAMLEVSVDTLTRWRQRGSGPPFCKFMRSRQAIIRYRLKDVEDFITASLRRSTSDDGEEQTDR